MSTTRIALPQLHDNEKKGLILERLTKELADQGVDPATTNSLFNGDVSGIANQLKQNADNLRNNHDPKYAEIQKDLPLLDSILSNIIANNQPSLANRVFLTNLYARLNNFPLTVDLTVQPSLQKLHDIEDKFMEGFKKAALTHGADPDKLKAALKEHQDRALNEFKKIIELKKANGDFFYTIEQQNQLLAQREKYNQEQTQILQDINNSSPYRNFFAQLYMENQKLGKKQRRINPMDATVFEQWKETEKLPDLTEKRFLESIRGKTPPDEIQIGTISDMSLPGSAQFPYQTRYDFYKVGIFDRAAVFRKPSDDGKSEVWSFRPTHSNGATKKYKNHREITVGYKELINVMIAGGNTALDFRGKLEDLPPQFAHEIYLYACQFVSPENLYNYTPDDATLKKGKAIYAEWSAKSVEKIKDMEKTIEEQQTRLDSTNPKLNTVKFKDVPAHEQNTLFVKEASDKQRAEILTSPILADSTKKTLFDGLENDPERNGPQKAARTLAVKTADGKYILDPEDTYRRFFSDETKREYYKKIIPNMEPNVIVAYFPYMSRELKETVSSTKPETIPLILNSNILPVGEQIKLAIKYAQKHVKNSSDITEINAVFMQNMEKLFTNTTLTLGDRAQLLATLAHYYPTRTPAFNSLLDRISAADQAAFFCDPAMNAAAQAMMIDHWQGNNIALFTTPLSNGGANENIARQLAILANLQSKSKKDMLLPKVIGITVGDRDTSIADIAAFNKTKATAETLVSQGQAANYEYFQLAEKLRADPADRDFATIKGIIKKELFASLNTIPALVEVTYELFHPTTGAVAIDTNSYMYLSNKLSIQQLHDLIFELKASQDAAPKGAQKQTIADNLFDQLPLDKKQAVLSLEQDKARRALLLQRLNTAADNRELLTNVGNNSTLQYEILQKLDSTNGPPSDQQTEFANLASVQQQAALIELTWKNQAAANDAARLTNIKVLFNEIIRDDNATEDNCKKFGDILAHIKDGAVIKAIVQDANLLAGNETTNNAVTRRKLVLETIMSKGSKDQFVQAFTSLNDVNQNATFSNLAQNYKDTVFPYLNKTEQTTVVTGLNDAAQLIVYLRNPELSPELANELFRTKANNGGLALQIINGIASDPKRQDALFSALGEAQRIVFITRQDWTRQALLINKLPETTRQAHLRLLFEKVQIFVAADPNAVPPRTNDTPDRQVDVFLALNQKHQETLINRANWGPANAADHKLSDDSLKKILTSKNISDNRVRELFNKLSDEDKNTFKDDPDVKQRVFPPSHVPNPNHR